MGQRTKADQDIKTPRITDPVPPQPRDTPPPQPKDQADDHSLDDLGSRLPPAVN